MINFRLSDLFPAEHVVVDGQFTKTSLPGVKSPLGICYAGSEHFLRIALDNPSIGAVIVAAELVDKAGDGKGVVAAEHPQLAYYQLHNRLAADGLLQVHGRHDIHPTAQIAASAVIGRNVVIGEGVVVEALSIIGDYSIIGAGTYIGERVVIGARGMQNTRIAGKPYPLAFVGGVQIGEYCQILAGAIVQRPYHPEYTTIGDFATISVNVVVGHGSQIGSHTMIGGSSQIAGNVVIGNNVWMGPSVTVADDRSIGDRANVKLGSVIVENVAPDQAVSGSFAIPHQYNVRIYARQKSGRS